MWKTGEQRCPGSRHKKAALPVKGITGRPLQRISMLYAGFLQYGFQGTEPGKRGLKQVQPYKSTQ